MLNTVGQTKINPLAFKLENIKYVAYVRKSTEELDRQALSIEAQKEAIKSQFPDLDITFIEESKSAASPGREVFNGMMTEIESGQYRGIIAWHPDRLSRRFEILQFLL